MTNPLPTPFYLVFAACILPILGTNSDASPSGSKLGQPQKTNIQKTKTARDWLSTGNYLLSQNRFKQALEAYEQCLILDPGNAYAKSNIVLVHNNWGIFYFRKAQYELAKQEWLTALNLDPKNRNVKNNLATWQKAMQKLGHPTDMSTTKEETSTLPISEKEEPQASAVVILSPLKKTINAREGAKAVDDKPLEAGKLIEPIKAEPAKIEPNRLKPASDIELSTTTKIAKPVEPAPYDQATPSTTSSAILMPRNTIKPAPMSQIDDNLRRLEIKIYGQPNSESSVVKRLEKMETETFGKPSSGAIIDRTEKLKQFFGIAN